MTSPRSIAASSSWGIATGSCCAPIPRSSTACRGRSHCRRSATSSTNRPRSRSTTRSTASDDEGGGHAARFDLPRTGAALRCSTSTCAWDAAVIGRRTRSPRAAARARPTGAAAAGRLLVGGDRRPHRGLRRRRSALGEGPDGSACRREVSRRRAADRKTRASSRRHDRERRLSRTRRFCCRPRRRPSSPIRCCGRASAAPRAALDAVRLPLVRHLPHARALGPLRRAVAADVRQGDAGRDSRACTSRRSSIRPWRRCCVCSDSPTSVRSTPGTVSSWATSR